MVTSQWRRFQRRARAYRKNNGLRAGGYVLFYDGRPGGWSSALHDNPGVLPGVIAVSFDDSEPARLAVGGDSCEGAEKWEVVSLLADPVGAPIYCGNCGVLAGQSRDGGEMEALRKQVADLQKQVTEIEKLGVRHRLDQLERQVDTIRIGRVSG